ncbi:FecR family protein [Flavitalea flava]
MNIDRLNHLFWQRYSGKITPEEEREFSVFAKNPENQPLLESCIDLFLERSPDLPVLSQEKVEGILSRIHGRYEPQVQPVRRIGYLRKWGWAAAVLLVTGVGTFLWSRYTKVNPSFANGKERIQTDIAPGGDKAILTLADGTRIVLDSTANTNIAQQGKTRISKPGSGILTYNTEKNASQHVPSGEALYNMVNTPRGGQFRVVLPDGTKVWLNAASSIRFPTAFTGSSRIVEVTGEAYLEVSKNIHQPFRVITDGIEIDVLGTSFNINAYTDESSINTTLVEGSISVASVMLRSGQQAQITRAGGQKMLQRPALVNNIDLDRVVAWKNGRFNFNGADIYAVMRQLSRWYDLDIKFEGGAPKLKLKGEMGRDLHLNEMLDLLSEMGIKFRIDGRTLIVGK